MIVMDGEEFLTAQEACITLGVKPATLYAYVSRGVLNSYRQGIKRMRLYRRDEVEQLLRLHGPTERGESNSGSSASSPQDDDEDSRAWIPYV